MDDSGWPDVLIFILSLSTIALLARLSSIGSTFSRSTLERLRDEKVPRAQLLLSLYRPRYILGQTISFGQTLAIAIGSLAFMHLMDPVVQPLVFWTVPRRFLSVVLFVLIGLLVYNAIPPYRREEGSNRPLPRLLWIYYPLYLLLLLPATLLLRIHSLFFSEVESKAIKEEELRHIVESETEEGTIEAEERDMIEGIFDFGDTTVREVMVPRIDVVSVEISTPPEALLKLIRETRHSRIPIYEERMDHIKGLIYIKDILHVLSLGKSWSIPQLMRPPYFVPENKKIDELLQDFKNAKVHMAIVVDEYGGTSGLVTMEDLIEEIVGEIQDEHDEETPLFHWNEEGQLIADARISIDELILLLGVELPQNGYETLGGFIYDYLGRIPNPNETLEFGILLMSIEQVVGQRITTVRIEKRQTHKDTEDQAEEIA